MVCGRVGRTEKREGSGEKFALSCRPSTESRTKTHCPLLPHTDPQCGRRKEDFGDHQLQPRHSADEGRGPGEGDQDQTASEKPSGPRLAGILLRPVHPSRTYKSIYDLYLGPPLIGLKLPLGQKLLDDYKEYISCFPVR